MGAGLFKKEGGLGVGGVGWGWDFSYLIFSWFIIFTFKNDFTKSLSAPGHSQHQPASAADISSQYLVHPAADDAFVLY